MTTFQFMSLEQKAYCLSPELREAVDSFLSRQSRQQTQLEFVKTPISHCLINEVIAGHFLIRGLVPRCQDVSQNFLYAFVVGEAAQIIGRFDDSFELAYRERLLIPSNGYDANLLFGISVFEVRRWLKSEYTAKTAVLPYSLFRKPSISPDSWFNPG